MTPAGFLLSVEIMQRPKLQANKATMVTRGGGGGGGGEGEVQKFSVSKNRLPPSSGAPNLLVCLYIHKRSKVTCYEAHGIKASRAAPPCF